MRAPSTCPCRGSHNLFVLVVQYLKKEKVAMNQADTWRRKCQARATSGPLAGTREIHVPHFCDSATHPARICFLRNHFSATNARPFIDGSGLDTSVSPQMKYGIHFSMRRGVPFLFTATKPYTLNARGCDQMRGCLIRPNILCRYSPSVTSWKRTITF